VFTLHFQPQHSFYFTLTAAYNEFFNGERPPKAHYTIIAAMGLLSSAQRSNSS
jgi:hypothetical protein